MKGKKVGRLTVNEVTVVVVDALSQVDVTLLAVSLRIEESSTKDSGLSLDLEANVLGGVSEALAIPAEVTFALCQCPHMRG